MRISQPYYLIIDLEATCTNDDEFPREEMEIIEIGAVVQHSGTFEIESEFQSFVRPIQNPQLTDFCTELTTISQSQVDGAPVFPDVLETLVEWRNDFPDSLFCSWGEYDREQFWQDCTYHDIDYPFGPNHFNLKNGFANSQGMRRPRGVADALRRLGMKFQGTHHRGIDDARNMARIVRRVCTGM